MSTIRVVIFLLGLALMAISIVLYMVPMPPERPYSSILFDIGLLLAVGAHGWPDNLT